MRFTIEQQELLSGMNKIRKTVEKRTTVPVISHALIRAEGDTVTLTATDLDVEVKTTLTATVTEAGAATISADMGHGIVSKLSREKLIDFNSDGVTSRVKSGRSDLKLASLPVDDFPPIAGADYTAELTISEADLFRLLDLSKLAISTEETRYYLNGIYLHPFEGTARAVATDGHRLACIDSAVQVDFPPVIIPRKTVGIILDLLEPDSGRDARVSVSATKIRFEIDRTVLTSKVIDGTFPDYTRVIPSSHNTEVIINAKDVQQASALVSQVSGERTKAVKVSASDGTLSLEVKNGAELGIEEVDAELIGYPITAGVNSRYLAEVLSVIGGDAASFKFTGSGDPIVIRPVEDNQALYVVMPMRI